MTVTEPYRCLGRPLPPVPLDHPMAVEMAAAPLMEAVVLRRPLVRISGDASAEAPLLAALATMASRLRRLGLAVIVRGEALYSVEPPDRPAGEVAILLEAPFYEDLGEWTEEWPGQTVILAGHDVEWNRAGILPDIVLAPFPDIDLTVWRARWREGALRGEKGALSAALACDLRSADEALYDVHRASTDQPTGWHSTDTGTWLAREELALLLRERPGILESIRALSTEGLRHARSIELLEAACRIG